MIHRALSADLAARLPPGWVMDPNEPLLGERRQSLSVDIQELYADDACAVTLRASWVLKRPDSPGLRASETIQTAAASCPGAEAVPAAFSQALGQLSDRIAAEVAQSVPTE
jgi:uncharacterized lipoprotein YmbA